MKRFQGCIHLTSVVRSLLSISTRFPYPIRSLPSFLSLILTRASVRASSTSEPCRNVRWAITPAFLLPPEDGRVLPPLSLLSLPTKNLHVFLTSESNDELVGKILPVVPSLFKYCLLLSFKSYNHTACNIKNLSTLVYLAAYVHGLDYPPCWPLDFGWPLTSSLTLGS